MAIWASATDTGTAPITLSPSISFMAKTPPAANPMGRTSSSAKRMPCPWAVQTMISCEPSVWNALTTSSPSSRPMRMPLPRMLLMSSAARRLILPRRVTSDRNPAAPSSESAFRHMTATMGSALGRPQRSASETHAERSPTGSRCTGRTYPLPSKVQTSRSSRVLAEAAATGVSSPSRGTSSAGNSAGKARSRPDAEAMMRTSCSATRSRVVRSRFSCWMIWVRRGSAYLVLRATSSARMTPRIFLGWARRSSR